MVIRLIFLVLSFFCYKASAFTFTGKIVVENYGSKEKLNIDFKQGSEVKVLFFWASWCTFCQEYSNILNIYINKPEFKNLKVYGLSADDDKRVGSQFRKSKYFQIKKHFWLSSQAKEDLDLQMLPVIVLIDGKGKVDTIYIGSQSDKKGYFEKRLKTLVGYENET